jgi:hypothetical protein
MWLNCIIKKLFVCITRLISWIVCSRIKHIWWNIVSSFAIYRIAIHMYCKFITSAIKFNSSNSIRYISSIYLFTTNNSDQLDLKIIHIRLAYSIRPPKFRILYLHISIWIFIINWFLFYFSTITIYFNFIFIFNHLLTLYILYSYCKVKYCILFFYLTIADPDIVKFNILVIFKIDIFPYT